MEMADLKINRETDRKTALAEPEMDYPYGLRIELCEETIQKLGLDKLPNPGSSIDGSFIANIESASIYKGPDGQKRSLCLQITKLGLGTEKEESNERMAKEKLIPNKPSNDGPSADKVLYGD